jgi:hypothetical protein
LGIYGNKSGRLGSRESRKSCKPVLHEGLAAFIILKPCATNLIAAGANLGGHSKTLILKQGLEEWSLGLPEEDAEALVDTSAGKAVRWVPGEGWVEERA